MRPPAAPAVDPLLSLDDFPIPTDTPAGGTGWSPFMVEMAHHIGAHATLVFMEHFGGRQLYVSADPARSKFRDLLGEQVARKIHATYGREVVHIPTAKAALDIARRASVFAMAREGMLSLAAAARIIGIRREYMSRLVNQGDEGKGIAPGPLPVRRQVRLTLRAAEIAAVHLARADASPAAIEAARTAIMGLAL